MAIFAYIKRFTIDYSNNTWLTHVAIYGSLYISGKSVYLKFSDLLFKHVSIV